MCSFLCGVMTAYFLHKTKDTTIRISRPVNVAIWLSSISIIAAIIFGMYPFHYRENLPSQFFHSFYMAGSQLGWSLSLSWIIFACHRGHGGVVNSFLSLPQWIPLARISLSIYLTHILAMWAVFGTQKQPAYYSEFVKTHLFFGDVVLSFAVAVLAYLTFEAPVLAIERCMLYNNNSSNNSNNSNNSSSSKETCEKVEK